MKKLLRLEYEYAQKTFSDEVTIKEVVVNKVKEILDKYKSINFSSRGTEYTDLVFVSTLTFNLICEFDESVIDFNSEVNKLNKEIVQSTGATFDTCRIGDCSL